MDVGKGRGWSRKWGVVVRNRRGLSWRWAVYMWSGRGWSRNWGVVVIKQAGFKVKVGGCTCRVGGAGVGSGSKPAYLKILGS